VSRHVRALEERLGFALFERTATGLELMPGSRAFAASVSEAFARILAATQSLVETHAHAVLVVRGYTTFLTRWLIPRLPGFQELHPDIDVRLVSGSTPVDFDRDAVDVAVRYGRGRWRGCRADLLFRDELVPVCHPDYLRAHGATAAEPLGNATLLHHSLRPADWADWLEASGMAAPAGGRARYFEDLGIIYESARASLGIAMGQREYVEADLRSGALVAPFATSLGRPLGYYLLSREERAELPKIRAFRDWLTSTPAAASARPNAVP
jgi:LysR family transcriptional regulator, glycine cleavage system transcriptional activator